MSDKEAVRLAEHIIRASFGDLVGVSPSELALYAWIRVDHEFHPLQHVASVLLNRGRLNLVELCHYAKLRARSAQAVIIILIQHNLAWHCEAPSGDNLTEYFEINLKECLMRLRWGRILALTEDEFGEDVSAGDPPISLETMIDSSSCAQRVGESWNCC
jgi:DNA-directed RNA polymerase III subunit RPC3